MKTIEDCYRIYGLANRIKRQSGFKYSKTKNVGYKQIKEEIDKIMSVMEYWDLTKINIEEVFNKVYSINHNLSLLNWELTEWER